MDFYKVDHPKCESFWVIIKGVDDLYHQQYLNTKLGWMDNISMATIFENKEECIDYKDNYAIDNFIDPSFIKCIEIYAEYKYFDGKLY